MADTILLSEGTGQVADFSVSFSQSLGSVTEGNNIVSGRISGEWYDAGPFSAALRGDGLDRFSFTVPSGYAVDRIEVVSTSIDFGLNKPDEFQANFRDFNNFGGFDFYTTITSTGTFTLYSGSGIGPGTYGLTVFDRPDSAPSPGDILTNDPDFSLDWEFIIHAIAVNQAPIANDDSGFTAGAGVLKSIDITSLLGNDTDPDGNTFSITAVTSSTGTVAINGSKIDFTPNANNTSGSASFVYTLSDGSLTDTATVTFAVGRTFNGGNGKDTLDGTAGDDILKGFNGTDILNGGAGDDWLNGGNGLDILTGDAGRDTFVLAKNAGGDTITDYADGVDVIALPNGLRFTDLTISASGGNTLINFGGGTLATLTGVNSSLIGSSDFVTVTI